MTLDYQFANRQTQAIPTSLFTLFGLVKLLKQPRPFVMSKSRAFILNRDYKPLPAVTTSLGIFSCIISSIIRLVSIILRDPL